MKKINFSLPAFAFSLALVGCATTDQNVQASKQVKLEDMMSTAQAASSAGKNEEAMATLVAATGAFPTEKTPWLQISQTHFDDANYGLAITNAQEVLQRDPEDRLASSIIAVSGLRLSTKALADLSRQNNLSGSLRTEAQDLAKLLRETLGEPVLVPVRSRAKASAPREPRASRPMVVKSPKPASRGDSNPFGALK